MSAIDPRTLLDWSDRPALQQPQWPDPEAVQDVLDQLRERLPLVSLREAERLLCDLGAVVRGEGFVLQGGPCAERFDESEASISRLVQVTLQMVMILMYGSGVPVVKIGRVAGQFGKPRSSELETRHGVTLPSYRGEIVNGSDFTPESRTPDPGRMLQAYLSAVSTLNYIRSITHDGFAGLEQVHAWNAEFVAASPQGQRYEQLATDIESALNFMLACGSADPGEEPELREAAYFVSHEALLLDYERALVRRDARTGQDYGSSAHMLWIGERTRQIDGAHVAFAASVANPIGVKLGPSATVAEALELCRVLNPDKLPGRLTFIVRMGARRVRLLLPALMAAVQEAGYPVVWISDPMHGNTQEVTSSDGQVWKTRDFQDILDELEGFFAVCRELDVWPGGVHLEMTGDDVTECLGGAHGIGVDELSGNYTSGCDPRLSVSQALELAFRVAEMLAEWRGV